ncbi:uncharacterized protein TM35_000771020 [Trypanosoma theileri]|uniref:Mucin-associated surface protein (MASP) n=1 Tax=Trypanosoma theileri TaxID=67003 RepID=A0A1X0NEX2_9TRYP|nr:uncharacterized protein TM35_000771020 [Trypanosoma theileri]ORC83140.1 hypothetical protein TM35_000771020 [Trypanosoma theileri]
MTLMMMGRVMCVLAVVLCCACGYTMAAAAAVDNDSPSGRGVSRGAVEVSCGAGGALRVRPAAESEWLTCGAGSRVSACEKYADLCSQRTARARGARTTTIATTTNTNGQPKAVMAHWSSWGYGGLTADEIEKLNKTYEKELEEREKKKIQQQQVAEQQVQNQQETSEPQNVVVETEQAVQDAHVLGSTSEPTSGQQKLSPGAPKEPLPQDIAEPRSAEEVTPHTQTPVNPTTGEHPTVEVDNNNQNAQIQSDNTKENSDVKEGIPANRSPSEVSSTADTQGTVTSTPVTANTDAETPNTPATTPPTTENTVEAPTTTPSPAVVIDPKISNIASTVQKKANVDSTVSPVWMRTAAPLLSVAVLFFFTVY